jgi:hypothetical protein
VPAAAVIPAPIAYIKVVAVKKFVVEFLAAPAVRLTVCTCRAVAKPCGARVWPSLVVRVRPASITVSKLECSKRAFAGIP